MRQIWVFHCDDYANSSLQRHEAAYLDKCTDVIEDLAASIIKVWPGSRSVPTTQ